MKAIILAAGQGTRLRPLTAYKPKCLVEVAGKPILEHQLKTLAQNDVTDIHIVAGYCAEQLECYPATVHINPDYALTNMVYTLFCAKSVMTNCKDLIISYGDIVYEPNVLAKLIESDAPVSLIVDTEWKSYWSARMENPLDDAETLKLKDGNKIVEIGKKPCSYSEVQGQYTGLIKVRADYVERLFYVWQSMDQNKMFDGKDFQNMYMTSFLQHLIDSGWDTRAVFIQNGWAEIDCEADLHVATQFWRNSYV